MKILVCIKQTADYGSLSRGMSDELRINHFDLYALEAAILIKEKYSGTQIDCLTMGSGASVSVLKRGLGMGADHGIHLITAEAGYIEAYRIADSIARCVQGRGYDLILAGVMSEDAMQGQVGPMLAEILGMPCASAVIEYEIMLKSRLVRVLRELEGGRREYLELLMPAVLTVQSGLNMPRYPALSKLLRAAKYPVEVVEIDSLYSPRQHIVRLKTPEAGKRAIILEGTMVEKAQQLYNLLNTKRFLRKKS